MLADAIDTRWRVLVLFGAYTGARIGSEAARVTVDDFDLLRRTVLLPGTKTKAARRTVSLPQFLCDEVAVHLSTHGPGDGGRVFAGSEGGPLSMTHFRRRVWKPAVAASVGEPMRLHDLRHTHAALLIHAGEDPYIISKRLGHASIRTTYDVYGHLFEGRDRQAADALEEAGRESISAAHADRMRTESLAKVIRLDA